MAQALDSAQLRDFEEVHRACESAESGAQLSEVIGGAIRQFGFRWFALVDDGDLCERSSGCLMLTNYPSSWVDEVISARLYRDDPVHAASIRSPTGLCWERIPEVIAPTRKQFSVLERGRAHGLTAGYTVPFRIPGERGAFFSVAGPKDRPFTYTEAITAQLIGGIAFQKGRALVKGRAVKARGAPLSPRQIDCLRLIAAGKTEWEIGKILGLSPSTVHEYVEGARRRYGVKTRSQLVLAAARDGYVSLNYLT
jgi:DNA-binding CsgD family transcriptional regulator